MMFIMNFKVNLYFNIGIVIVFWFILFSELLIGSFFNELFIYLKSMGRN